MGRWLWLCVVLPPFLSLLWLLVVPLVFLSPESLEDGDGERVAGVEGSGALCAWYWLR